MSDRPSSKLIRTIEGEIVPRLLLSLAHSTAVREQIRPEGTGAAVAEFARLLLEPDGASAAAFVRMTYPQGTPAARICLGLMAPAARRLGDLWERQECRFEELIGGLSRIESLLREVGS